MAYPNNQIENLLTEIETVLSTYDPSGYFAGAKFFPKKEDEVINDNPKSVVAQGKYAVFFLSCDGGVQDEAFYEDFRIYTVTMMWKFMERNLELSDKKNKRIADAIRDLFWRKIQGTYYYNCNQEGLDNFSPQLSVDQTLSDVAIERSGKKLIHRGQQVWKFYTCIDHQTIDPSSVKSGSVTAGERI